MNRDRSDGNSAGSALLELLLDPDQYDRPPLLLSRLSDLLAALPRGQVTAFLESELGNPGRPLHFRFVLLQAAGRLAWAELLPVLRGYILTESAVQLVKEALKAMTAVHGLSSYRFCRELTEKSQRPELVELARVHLEALIRDNRIVYQFHHLIQGSLSHRDPFAGLESLAKNLDRKSRELIVPALRRLEGMELAALARLAGLCADAALTGPILNRLQRDWHRLPGELTRELLWALGRCAIPSGKGEKVGKALCRLFPATPAGGIHLAMIWSLPLLDPQTRGELFSLFPRLAPVEKTALLQAVEGEDVHGLAPLVADALEWESDDTFFEGYVEWLLARGYTRVCLDCLDRLKGNRLRMLIGALCAGDCKGCGRELLPYFHSGMDNELLVSLAGGLLKSPDRAAVARAWELMNSGVSDSVLSVLVRRLPDWLPVSGVSPEEVFRVCLAMPILHREWLISWSRLLERTEDAEDRLRILDGVMVLFEKAADADPLPYAEVFRRLNFRNPEELRLVREEVQLILNTMLRLSGSGSTGQTLAALLRELDQKAERLRK